jgi:hypothetical protein
MGQYHTIAAFPHDPDSNEPVETIQHYTLGAGAKMAEQYYAWEYEKSHQLVTSPYVMACALMIAGPWQDKRIITIGDYSDGMGGNWWPYPGEPCDYYAIDAVADDSNDIGSDDFPMPVVDRTAEATVAIGEYLGMYRKGEAKWDSIGIPDDFDQRLARLSMMPRRNSQPLVLVAVDQAEYLDPLRLATTDDPLIAPAFGMAWPSALAMTALSDGAGGGDWRLEPYGRWALTRLRWMRRSDVSGVATDVTDWLLQQDEVRWHLAKINRDKHPLGGIA